MRCLSVLWYLLDLLGVIIRVLFSADQAYTSQDITADVLFLSRLRVSFVGLLPQTHIRQRTLPSF